MRLASPVEDLLRVARAERPPEGNEARVLAALGLGTIAAVGGAGAGSMAGGTGTMVARAGDVAEAAGRAARWWARWTWLGVVMGAVIVGAGVASRAVVTAGDGASESARVSAE